MKKRTHLILIGLAVVASSCIIGLTQLSAQSFGGKKAVPTKVAVCRISDIFSKNQRNMDLKDEMEKQYQAFLAERQKRTAQMEDLNQQKGGYLEGKPEYKKISDQINRQAIEFQVWEQMQQNEFVTKQIAIMKTTYQQINDTIAEVAKERGIDIVLQFSPSKIDAPDPQEWHRQAQMRQVLYSEPDLDITADVLQRLDETYRLSKQK